jgi:hypothetical protein
MVDKPKLNVMFFFNIYLIISFILFLSAILASYSHAGGYISAPSMDYAFAPPVGSNVVGYMIGDYIDPQLTHIHLFIKKCECLKRVSYRDGGIFSSYMQALTKEEFDGLTPDVLVGMIDPDGQISMELSNGLPLIAVVEQVLEYKKLDTKFVARVSLKFVEQIP